MKKQKTIIIVLAILILVLLGGMAAVIILNQYQPAVEEDENLVVKGTFEEFTDSETLRDLPVLYGKGMKIGTPFDYGTNDDMIDVSGTTLEDYQTYLDTLEENGYKKHSDNGENGLDGYVYTASFKKDKVSVTVCYVKNQSKTYIIGSHRPLSDHLIYDETRASDALDGAKTKVHLFELNDTGNCYIIQLKNGHFILEDGGKVQDAPYILDYLEELTPGDEKPVIEAWFISHAHIDHMGAMQVIMNDASMCDRIYVEGVYFVEPGPKILDVITSEDPSQNVWFVNNSVKAFKTETGEMPNLYRPHLGERYYFCDISIEVPLTLEQIPADAYYATDFNDTSLWLLHNIEGQRFLHAGDAGISSTRMAMSYYDKSFFELDVFSVLHHGINVFDYFTEYCDIKTLLYTVFRTSSSHEPGTTFAREEENERLRQSALECYSYGEGTVVLTFPYEVGEAEIMPHFDWKYNNGTPKRQVHGVD